MNKKVFVRDITGGQLGVVREYFAVLNKGRYTKKNGDIYVVVTLRDSTGSIEGRIWDRAQDLESSFDEGDIVLVTAIPKVYNDKVQLTITDIQKIDVAVTADEIVHFFPAGGGKENLSHSDYFKLIGEITNPHLKKLFDVFNNRGELRERFFLYPASTGVHHVYAGGLLEHSVSVAKMGKAVVACLGGNTDIIVTGGILHDVGKIEEFDISRGFKFTDRGRLLGHITLGVTIIEDLIRRVDSFPPDLTDILTHIIVSHHGLEKWGSPKKPMFAEALMIHFLDNLDSKVMGVREYMKENMTDGKWTGYHRLYESKFYKITDD